MIYRLRKTFVLYFLITLGLISTLQGSAGSELNDVIGADSPVLSPDDKKLVFTYQGDIWTVSAEGGNARRLTVHEADDVTPAFSPDGKWIAFSSDRFGSLDVFIMAEDGGEPVRLTYHSTDDVVLGFTPDSQYVYFNSSRDWLKQRIWKVSINGGQPFIINKEEADEGAISPDGSRIAFTYGRINPYRKGYHGPANSDIWIRDIEADTIRQLTDYDGVDRSPMWAPDGKTIFFVSDRETGVFNIWAMDTGGENLRSITRFDKGNILSPSISFSGKYFVFIHNFRIYRCNLSGAAEEFSIQTAADYRRSMFDEIEFSSEANEAAISDDEKQIAFIHHGEIFVVDIEGGKAMRLTETAARESDVHWMPGAEEILFISDRTGMPGIYKLKSALEDEKRLFKARFTEVEEFILEKAPVDFFRISPDGEKIVYHVKSKGLYMADREGKEKRLLLETEFIEDVSFSGDGRWLTYSRMVDGWNYDVFIMSVETGKEYDVSMLPGAEFDPFFSDDGKRLVFTGFGDREADIFAVWLTLEEHQKYREEEEDEEDQSGDKDEAAEKSKEKDKKEEEKKAEEKEAEKVEIDLVDIHKRVEKVVSTRGYNRKAALSPDGKTFVFVSNALDKWGLFTYTEEEGALKKIADMNASWLKWSQDGSKIYYLKHNGNLGSIDPQSGAAAPINFNGKMDVDRREEFKQMYREAWNAIKYNFYDPNLHGADWDAAYEKYYPLVEHSRSTREIHHAIRMMLGELNASHLGIWKSGDRKGKDTGYIGVRLGDYEKGKGYPVIDVIPESPADREESKIRVGEYIHAVDRKTVTPEQTIAVYFNDTIDELTEIELLSLDSKPERRIVTLKPVSYWKYYRQAYEQWVEQKRAMVEEISGGKIGYAHIRSMNHSSLRQFERDLFSYNWNKEALIIDVRYNPGGHIHNQLIDLLQGEAFGYSLPRNGKKQYQPDFVWRKPSALLINERSFSDAEVFPNAYQTLGIGKVIGTPTFGGVIGTGGMSLLDGSWFRLPWIGWYTIDGRNMENTGAEPDILIERLPTEIEEGKDSQLVKAVEVLMDELNDGND